MAKRFIEIIKTNEDKMLVNADFIYAVEEHALANGAFGWTNVYFENGYVVETYEPYRELIERIQKGGAE